MTPLYKHVLVISVQQCGISEEEHCKLPAELKGLMSLFLSMEWLNTSQGLWHSCACLQLAAWLIPSVGGYRDSIAVALY